MKKLSLIFLASLNLHAATYYVDPATGNDSNNGTATGTPWAHMPGAVGFGPGNWHQLVNGDTLYVKGGSANNYTVLFQPTWYSGSAAYDSILVQSGDLVAGWGTGKALFDGQSTRTCELSIGVTSGGVPQGITIDGFEVAHIAGGATTVPGTPGSCCIAMDGNGNPTSSFITITRCYLHDSSRDATDHGHGIEMGLASNFRISRCTIGPGIGSKGIEPSQCSSGVISNNFVSGTGDHAIALTRSTNIDVCNNLIQYPTNSLLNPACCIVLPSSDHCDVWNNVAFKNSPTTIWGMSGTITYNNGAGNGGPGISNRFCFNTYLNINDFSGGASHYATAFRLGDPQVSGNLLGFKAYNNIFMPGNIYAGMLVPGASSNDDVEYNDFWIVNGAQSDHVLDSYNGSSDSDATVLNFSPGAGHTWANNQQLNPIFTGGTLPSGLDANFHPNTAYFSLASSSPTAVNDTAHSIPSDPNIGYNHSSTKFNLDIVGNTRSGQAMGAYEHPSDPLITAQPQNASISSGSTATFSVTASGNSTLSYQWYTNNGSGPVAVTGATSSSWTTPAAPLSWNGLIVYVAVTDIASTINSATAILTVTSSGTAPVITTQPLSITVITNLNATFTVVATGTATLTYLWSSNNVNIAGATSPSYTVNGAQLAWSGSAYHCGVTNSIGGVQSQDAILTVITNYLTGPIVYATNMYIGTVRMYGQ